MPSKVIHDEKEEEERFVRYTDSKAVKDTVRDQFGTRKASLSYPDPTIKMFLLKHMLWVTTLPCGPGGWHLFPQR